MASATLPSTEASPATAAPPAFRLVRRAGVAALAALGVNLLLRELLVRLLPPDAAGFFGLGLAPVAVSTLVGVAGAAAAFALVRRLARDPVRAYRRVAVVALLLSLLPALMMHLNPTPQGSLPLAAMLALWSMHVSTALVVVPTLTRKA